MASLVEIQRATYFPQRSVWPGGVSLSSTAAASAAVMSPNYVPYKSAAWLEKRLKSCSERNLETRRSFHD
jgi:hypothetical protein